MNFRILSICWIKILIFTVFTFFPGISSSSTETCLYKSHFQKIITNKNQKQECVFHVYHYLWWHMKYLQWTNIQIKISILFHLFCLFPPQDPFPFFFPSFFFFSFVPFLPSFLLSHTHCINNSILISFQVLQFLLVYFLTETDITMPHFCS